MRILHALTFLLAFLASSLSSLHAAEPLASSLLHEGDRWVFLGDSITAHNCYAPLVGRVFKHYHPDSTLTIINSGQGGDTASADPQKLMDRVLKHKPTVVSIMYGMNEAINAWGPAQKKETVQESYRASLTYMVKTLKEQGITVLLMSPSQTDPSTHTFFTLDKTPAFLRECAAIMKSVAESEGVFYVPVQEDFSSFQENLPRGVALTADGVHPSALGHYSIARSLWSFCGIDKPLSKGNDRQGRVEKAGVPAITARLTNRFIKTNAGGVELSLSASSPVTAEITWSLAGKSAKTKGDEPVYEESIVRGKESVKLNAGDNAWTLPIANAALPPGTGRSADLLLDVSTTEGHQLYIIDLSRTRVLHLSNNSVSGEVNAPYERPEGKKLATWEARLEGDSLLLSFEVFDKELVSEGDWPFGRDGLNLMLDFRPTERFADIGVDREVTQLFLNVRDKPFFGVGLKAWTGWGMDFASYTDGSRSENGYKVRVFINDKFNLKKGVEMQKRDFVGLLVSIADHPTIDGRPNLKITPNQDNDAPVYLYANNFMILDLHNKLPDDQIINAHLTDILAP